MRVRDIIDFVSILTKESFTEKLDAVNYGKRGIYFRFKIDANQKEKMISFVHSHTRTIKRFYFLI